MDRTKQGGLADFVGALDRENVRHRASQVFAQQVNDAVAAGSVDRGRFAQIERRPLTI